MTITSPLPATSATASSVPHLRALPKLPAQQSAAGADVRTLLPHRLPDGATVLAALPQAVLPEQLLEQYVGVGGQTSGTQMVGYLVLVPVGSGLPGEHFAVPAAEPREAEGIVVDTVRRIAQVDGAPLDLTYLEFELLAHLTAHPHRVHSRDHLVSAVWGYGHVGDGRTVDVHIARLRRKLGPLHRDRIVTVRRVGYKYVPPARG